ncbi:MAG TPA: hypothetical protein ENJ18_07535 [Nannocystis exedens]|nr:hypothetical protein [Nannocystis exedens]
MHVRRGLRLFALGALAILILGPSTATAGDGTHPRTPTLFDDPLPPCMTIVNRSIDPVTLLHYTIPYEDLKPEYDPDDMATWHEVEDGRTHQFAAFCRDHSPQDPLPNWIANADVDAALAKELVDPDIVGPEDVLDTSTVWEGCWQRITADDERRPITFAEAAKPVPWDTTGLEIGGYVVEGYTWEPQPNIWSFRSGVVKVVDSDDLSASPPAVAIENNLDLTYADQAVPLEVCHSTTDGSTLTAYWSFTDADKIKWIPFIEDQPVVGDDSTIEFMPPPETSGSSVMIRVDITDPMDRTATAFGNYTIVIIEGMGETGDTCDGSFVIDPECETTGSSGTTDGSESASDGSSGDGSDGSGSDGSSGSGNSTGQSSASGSGGEDEPGSCSCRLDDPRPAAALALLTLLMLGRRRRH